MKTARLMTAAVLATTALVSAANAQSLTPLATFGTNGLLPAGSAPWLGTGALERGLAYNPATGNLLLMSRQGTPGGTLTSNPILVLNGTTGAQTGQLDKTGVTGGTFPNNMLGAGDDGVIYLANLTSNATTSNFIVYRYANESAVPTIAYSGNVGSTAARFGDSLDVIGSGVNTRIVAGAGNSPAGFNSFALLTTADGSTFSGSYVTVTGPANGDFRLGITFTTPTNVLGTQGSLLRSVDISSPTTGTMNPNPSAATATGSSRPMDFAVVGGVPVLATIDTVDQTLRILDMTNPAAPVFILQSPYVGVNTGNGNGVGQVKFGAITGGTAILYAMSTNNGIQAFTLTIPEPTTLGLLAGVGAMLLRRKSK
jgi:Domain of unknown function (DUF4623)